MERYSGAEAFIDVLNANGVENVFLNPGGDQTVNQTTIARYRLEGKQSPRLVLCLHESVAMSAAYGSYAVSGKPQVVLVHSELGTQQLCGAMLNAQWGRIPVIVWAGVQPGPHRVNWKGEPNDQGMMLRNSVKWDHTLIAGEHPAEALQKAFTAALTEPRGPVYMLYPLDMPAAQFPKVEASPAVGNVKAAPLDMAKLEEVADALVKAEYPLIVPGSTGRHAESVDSLVQLAEALCAPVLAGGAYLCFPGAHPLAAGVEHFGGFARRNPFIRAADVFLVLDYDQPYAGREQSLPNARVIKIGPDQYTAGRPLWNRGADIYIKADDCRQVIPALTRMVSQKLTPQRKAQLSQRLERVKAEIEAQRAEWRSDAQKAANARPILGDWVCRCLDEVIDEDTIVMNCAVSDSHSVVEQVTRSKPGTYFTNSGGSISWSLPAALGAKIAAPDRTVVTLMSDGEFMWSCAEATLWTARAYNAPTLGIVFDNQAYGAHHGMVKGASGIEQLSDRMAFEAGVDIPQPPDYVLVARSCGAYGRKVEDPKDVKPAIKEALRQVRQGRSAILDMRIARP